MPYWINKNGSHECSKCGLVIDDEKYIDSTPKVSIRSKETYNFCPKCGSKMDNISLTDSAENLRCALEKFIKESNLHETGPFYKLEKVKIKCSYGDYLLIGIPDDEKEES